MHYGTNQLSNFHVNPVHPPWVRHCPDPAKSFGSEPDLDPQHCGTLSGTGFLAVFPLLYKRSVYFSAWWYSVPVFRIRFHWVSIRIHRFRLNTDPDPVFLMTKNWKNVQLKIFLIFFWSKITIFLSIGLHKGRPSYRRNLQPSKENIQHFKTLSSSTFFYFCESFLSSWIRIHWPDWIWIRIRLYVNRPHDL